MMPSNNTLRRCMKAAAILACLVSFYVLSIGPAAYFERRTGMRSGILDAVYAPLELLHKNELMPKPLKRYIEFWQDLAQGHEPHIARK